MDERVSLAIGPLIGPPMFFVYTYSSVEEIAINRSLSHELLVIPRSSFLSFYKSTQQLHCRQTDKQLRVSFVSLLAVWSHQPHFWNWQSRINVTHVNSQLTHWNWIKKENFRKFLLKPFLEELASLDTIIIIIIIPPFFIFQTKKKKKKIGRQSAKVQQLYSFPYTHTQSRQLSVPPLLWVSNVNAIDIIPSLSVSFSLSHGIKAFLVHCQIVSLKVSPLSFSRLSFSDGPCAECETSCETFAHREKKPNVQRNGAIDEQQCAE
jgi:hypothetical protein